MAAAHRHEADPVSALPSVTPPTDQLPPAADRHARAQALLAALAERPYRYEFYAMMRAVECFWPRSPRLGTAARPVDEPIRVSQDPSLDFAPSSVSSFAGSGAAPRIGVRMFGMYGSHGALPLHLTEFIRSREHNDGDATLRAFIDVFQHRMLCLFYRAWAQAQPACDLDRREDSRFETYIGALAGLGQPELRGRDRVPDAAKLHHAAWLARGVRCGEAVTDILARFFAVPARIEYYAAHWMRLRRIDCTRLGGPGLGARLGAGALAGDRVLDRQSKFRIHLGPLSLAQYLRFLPGEPHLLQLRDWIRQIVGFDLVWDLRLHLRREEVQAARLDGRSRLGYTAWLDPRKGPVGCDGARIDPETAFEVAPA
jgi:type VI secretion system protein ImpH